ncbi:chromate resistance protein ChrB domain-containing protein [Pseudonocardia dioxanivorans]|uniref:chromate resistance protein ChrB domain-containing protein n=1 Tax=Pseudonocardia dioxanivorans TaxID=240495 RepID=UPI00389AD8A9
MDPGAEFVFLADPADATPFDMRGVEICRHQGDCSFETIRSSKAGSSWGQNRQNPIGNPSTLRNRRSDPVKGLPMLRSLWRLGDLTRT